MGVRPLVSAIIPTYNNGDMAVEAVESVLGQTYRPLECVVADDGSEDGTLDRLREFGDRVRLVPCEHRGVSATRNAALQASKGDIVAFLDADDLWMPQKLERCVPRLLAGDDTGAAYTRVEVRDLAKGQRYALDVYELEGDLARTLFVECRMSTSCLIVRRAALDSAGLFDESFQMCEDWDFMLRLAESWKYAFVHEALTVRRLHSSNITRRRSDIYAKHNLMVIRKALARRPDLYGDLERLALAKAHTRFGLEHYRRFDMRPARAEFARSLRHRPTAEALKYYARTFLPPALVRRLRQWRERAVRFDSEGQER